MIDELSRQFPIPGVTFSSGNGGLPRVIVDTPIAKGEVYLHGAHVTQFQPMGQEPVLWMSRESMYESNKPIRGGVPICFPWFGPHATNSSMPGHGWARLSSWVLQMCGRTAGGGVSLGLSHKIEGFDLDLQIEFGKSLRMMMRVALSDGVDAPRKFEEALHTYFHIGDIHRISIRGLESVPYLDKVGGLNLRSATKEPIRFTGETDRVYENTQGTCWLDDPVAGRTICVRKSGSSSTVVWNPWIEKSRRMPDFGDDEWPGMVCIETANVGGQAIELYPCHSHTMQLEIEVMDLPG
jgi:glucose-6-phosphate 1-epimerase